jgi:hypothetical protein
MAGEHVPVLEEWVPTPRVADMLKVSDSSVRKGALQWGWWIIDPDINKTEVAKIEFKGNWCYVIRKHAALREQAKRVPLNAQRAEKQKAKAAQAWRVRFRNWARAEGHVIRLGWPLSEALVEAYKQVHPEDPPPEGYDVTR